MEFLNFMHGGEAGYLSLNIHLSALMDDGQGTPHVAG